MSLEKRDGIVTLIGDGEVQKTVTVEVRGDTELGFVPTRMGKPGSVKVPSALPVLSAWPSKTEILFDVEFTRTTSGGWVVEYWRNGRHGDVSTTVVSTTQPPDVVLVNSTSNNISVLLGQADSTGKADGTFTEPGLPIRVGTNPSSVVAAGLQR